ncbi:hypothetical protein RchiOBHm_Chr1g0351361 [Rosa chinensis]|uniref:Uncharacterized protein n=1 Tax=Rosa chinensis TaxID=74649 RepID=A0A2P6SGA2_ROSCH|nr:hypothetical protein RchiOBHm_Chr1g0351361 [Rosa chinensis]
MFFISLQFILLFLHSCMQFIFLLVIFWHFTFTVMHFISQNLFIHKGNLTRSTHQNSRKLCR